MIVFKSLQAALNAGFRWHSFSAEYNLHIVEMDRESRTRRGQREKALAFANVTEESHE